MKITDLLNAQSVKVGAAAANQADAIDQLVALQVAAGNVSDADGYKAGVLAREAEFSTAVGDGIAIPHAKSSAVASRRTVCSGKRIPDTSPRSIIFPPCIPVPGKLPTEGRPSRCRARTRISRRTEISLRFF